VSDFPTNTSGHFMGERRSSEHRFRAVENMLLLLLPRRKFPMPVRYGTTAAIVGAAALLRGALNVPMQQSPLLMFVPAVFLCALLFDKGSGFFATLLSAAIAAYFFMGPAENLAFGVPRAVFILVFIIIGFTIAAVTEALRKTVHKFDDARKHQVLLMREMAHRVKNDLALISSAISLQARTSDNEEVRKALEAANGRVHVIAAAQALLRPGDGGAVDLPNYLQSLCNGLGEMLRGIRPIAIRVQCTNIVLPGPVASSVGLIVNELVTNSLKYAYPDDTGGIIEVVVEPDDKEGLVVTVKDNGLGCEERATGLGSRLVRLLAKQRGGAFTRVSRDVGCEARATLPDLK
jgi:two-component sensor histidine kinase